MTLTTHREINDLEVRDKKYNRGCGDGLYLKVECIKKGGNKYFFAELKKKSVWIGKYGTGPKEYSLKDAKNTWYKIKQWAITHNEHPKNYKNKDIASLTHTLRDAVDGFLKDIASDIKETTLKEYHYKLHNQVLKNIDGDTPLKDLEWDNGGRERIKHLLNIITDGRKYELRERCRKLIKQTIDYAIDEGWVNRGQNPAEKESRKSIAHKITHHATIKWDQVPDLIKAINQNKCNAEFNTVLCTKLMLLTGLRAGAVTRLEWGWIKEVNGITCIVIPASTSGLKRKKGKSDHKDHHVPITKEIASILKRSKELNGDGQYIFKAWRTKKYPHLNPEAPNKFLQNVGYKNILVAHGWRSVLTTVCKEQLKYPLEIIKLQLGHLPNNKVDAAYDKSLMLQERLDLLKSFNAQLVEEGLVL